MLEIGRITSPHGVRGDVNVVLTSNRTERVDSGSVLSTPGGPMTVVSSRPHKNGFIVKFEGVNFRDQSEALRNPVNLGGKFCVVPARALKIERFGFAKSCGGLRRQHAQCFFVDLVHRILRRPK